MWPFQSVRFQALFWSLGVKSAWFLNFGGQAKCKLVLVIDYWPSLVVFWSGDPVVSEERCAIFLSNTCGAIVKKGKEKEKRKKDRPCACDLRLSCLPFVWHSLLRHHYRARNSTSFKTKNQPFWHTQTHSQKIKIWHKKNRPKHSTRVQIEELASLDTKKNLRQEKY